MMPRDCSRSSVAGVLSKPGNRKNGGRFRGATAVQRRFDRRYAVIDLLDGRIGLDSLQAWMGPGVGADGVAFRRDPAHQFRVFRRRLADQEKRRVHAFMGQRRQHLRRGRRPWAVIEGQHHLVIFKRQRLRKALEPDPRRSGGIDGFSMREVPSASLRGQDSRLCRSMSQSASCNQGKDDAQRAHRHRGPFRSVHLYHCAWRCPLGNA